MNNDWKSWIVFGGCILLWSAWAACNSEILRPNVDHSTFLKVYGGANDQTGQDLIQPAEGGFMLLGSTNSTEDPATEGQNRNMYWVQTDERGNVVKSQIYDRSSRDEGKALLELEDGFLMLANVMGPNGMGNIWLIRSDVNGIPMWQKKLGKEAFIDHGEDLLLDSANHIWIVGTTTDVNIHKQEGFSSETDVSDIYIAKLDLQGNLFWERRLGFEGADEGKSLLQLSNGNIAILGHTDFPDPNPQSFDLLYFALAESGIPVHSQRFGQVDRDERAVEIILLQDGEILLLGNSRVDSSVHPYLVGIKEQTQTGSEAEYLLNVEGRASGIAELPSGGCVIAGNSTERGDHDFLLIRLDENREMLWTKAFGSTGDSFAGNIIVPSDSAIAFVGTHAFGNNRMMSLIQTNQNGELNP